METVNSNIQIVDDEVSMLLEAGPFNVVCVVSNESLPLNSYLQLFALLAKREPNGRQPIYILERL
jgi:hypothetical protein